MGRDKTTMFLSYTHPKMFKQREEEEERVWSGTGGEAAPPLQFNWTSAADAREGN